MESGTVKAEGIKSIKIHCTIKHETDKALLIVSDGQECWLPKSHIEYDKDADEAGTVHLPEWLATKRGLI
jgi:hypothetical protein